MNRLSLLWASLATSLPALRNEFVAPTRLRARLTDEVETLLSVLLAIAMAHSPWCTWWSWFPAHTCTQALLRA